MGTSVLAVVVTISVAFLFFFGPFLRQVFMVGWPIASREYKWAPVGKRTLVITAIWVALIIVNCFYTVPHEIRSQADTTHPPQPKPIPTPWSQISKYSYHPPLDKTSHGDKPQPVLKATPQPAPQPAPQNFSSTSRPAPKTLKERIDQLNQSLAKTDRDRLAEAFHDFYESLNQGTALMYKGFHEAMETHDEGPNLPKNVQLHIAKLRDLASSAKAYGKSNQAIRVKWDFYPEQENYIFGDNPDNGGWGKLANAFDWYAYRLESWAAIQNKDDPHMVNMLSTDRTDFETQLSEYSKFNQECKARLNDMRESIK
jgi:hypothetical protein